MEEGHGERRRQWREWIDMFTRWHAFYRGAWVNVYTVEHIAWHSSTALYQTLVVYHAIHHTHMHFGL